tara:strand:+ start:89 stop:727 length:639 start_codon:yes stop_codon:yes gene_type:complete
LLKGIIFDFDGVIAESVQVKTDAFALLYAPYGKEVVKNVVEHHEANGGMSRYEKIKLYHESFLNKTISEKRISDLAKQFSELVIDKVIAAPYVPGVLGYIKKSYKQYNLFISTGTPTEEMKQILNEKNIAQYFTAVFGSPDRKDMHINQIKSRYGMKSNDLIFFGDSNSDLDAAENANIDFILIKNRFNKKLVKSFTGKIIENFVGFEPNYY